MPKHREVLPVKRDRILNFMTAEELLGWVASVRERSTREPAA